MPKRPRTSDDLDSPWKEALEHFLGPFLSFFFPHIFDAIDWGRGYESLDKELQQIVRSARTGKRIADKLFKVWRKDGREAWLLIHIEVQGKQEKEFPERMFIYSYRIYDRYRCPVVSLAVLCDDNPKWRPNRFEVGAWGGKVSIRFLTAKILDYKGREDELEKDKNPFAAVALAQLKVIETRGAPDERHLWKLRLMKGLFQRGLGEEEIRQLLRLLDWMIQLPKELEEQLRDEIARFEEEQNMPYVTSFERLAKEEGIAIGLSEAVRKFLIKRFGAAGKKLLPKLEVIKDVEQLRALLDAVGEADTLDKVKQLLS